MAAATTYVGIPSYVVAERDEIGGQSKASRGTTMGCMSPLPTALRHPSLAPVLEVGGICGLLEPFLRGLISRSGKTGISSACLAHFFEFQK